MTIDQSILLWCAAVPALIALAAAVIAWLVERSWPATVWASPSAAVVASAGWWLSIAVALAASESWQWWPEDAWQRAVWPILAAALLLSSTAPGIESPGGTAPANTGSIGTGPDSDRSLGTAGQPWRWVVAGLLASATAWLAMPGGSAWSDTFGLHRTWMFAVTASCLLNGWAMDRLARAGAQRWVLWVVLAGLGGAMATAVSAYSALAEWTIAAIAATVVFAVLNSLAASTALWSIAFPAVTFLGAMTAAGRFYSYEDVSPWLYAGVLFLPALVAVADCPLRNQPLWRRVAVAALLAALLVGVITWAILFRGE